MLDTELDRIYGKAIDPQPTHTGITVYDWERKYEPYSLTILSETSVADLRVFMQCTIERWLIGQVLASDVIIIWLADQNGVIRYAIEEMYYNGQPTGSPKLQNFEVTRSIPKLGHPSLVRGGRARIAGEIRLGIDQTVPIWIINNHSARYGRDPSREYVHLRNVANRFRYYGIELAESFAE